KSAVARGIDFGDVAVQVQDLQVGLVTNGVDHDLQSAAIGGLDTLKHHPFGQHLVKEQTAIAGLIIIGLKEQSGGAAQAAIRETFQDANSQQVVAEVGTNA